MPTYSRTIDNIDWDAAAEVFRRALGKREPSKLKRAFENSAARAFAFEGETLVGLGRGISDGEYQAAIYDVVVLPEFQRRGIGTQLMKELMDQLKVDNVILYAVPGKEGFYAKCGFRKMTTAMGILHPWMAGPNRGYLDESATLST